MKYKVSSDHALAKYVSWIAVLGVILLGSLPARAGLSHQTPPDHTNGLAEVIRDFTALAQMRPQKCTDDKSNERDALGWRKDRTQCAWKNLLQVQQWKTEDRQNPGSCLSRQAIWWAWARPRFAANAAPITWNNGWVAQSMESGAGQTLRIGVIARLADGSWSATEWSWQPSLRPATRQWQAARWKLLSDAAMRLRQQPPDVAIPREAEILKSTWEKNLNGVAGEIAAGTWLWERSGLCMRMETVGISQAQLHIPYSKDDGRLEQRAAMQVKLARTYPQATWLTTFRLLPLPEPATQGGAKYEAIWLENAMVKGQLWMPGKSDGAILRARIVVALPEKKIRDAAAIDSVARSIDRELIGLATIWTVDHEQ